MCVLLPAKLNRTDFRREIGANISLQCFFLGVGWGLSDIVIKYWIGQILCPSIIGLTFISITNCGKILIHELINV